MKNIITVEEPQDADGVYNTPAIIGVRETNQVIYACPCIGDLVSVVYDEDTKTFSVDKFGVILKIKWKAGSDLYWQGESILHRFTLNMPWGGDNNPSKDYEGRLFTRYGNALTSRANILSIKKNGVPISFSEYEDWYNLYTSYEAGVLPEDVEFVVTLSLAPINIPQYTLSNPDVSRELIDENFEENYKPNDWQCSISLPKGITTIDSYAIYDCTFDEIVLPITIDQIDKNAFSYYRKSNCRTVFTYKGTKAQWNAIEKDDEWRKPGLKFTITCTDGTISYT